MTHWVEGHERHVSAAAFIIGFVFDWFTLTRIDFVFDNLVQLFYVLVSGTGILLLNMYFDGRLRAKIFESLVSWLPAVIQFAFGGVMSTSVVFYIKSGSFAVSWPFLLLLLAIFVGNETLRSYYTKLTFQISLFFFSLFLLSIYYVPMLIGRMGWWVFILSGISSLLLIGLFIRLLSHFRPKQIQHGMKLIVTSITGIYIVIHIFYFTNLIPPVPLSLKEVGVYHGVTRTDTGYNLAKEISSCRFFCSKKVHFSGNPLYVYSAVFAPTRLNTTIAHKWEYWNESKEEWITASTIQFPISGGRAEGYRGYSQKSNLFPGLWRVDVVTGGGQVVGRVKFNIIASANPIPMETITK